MRIWAINVAVIIAPTELKKKKSFGHKEVCGLFKVALAGTCSVGTRTCKLALIPREASSVPSHSIFLYFFLASAWRRHRVHAPSLRLLPPSKDYSQKDPDTERTFLPSYSLKNPRPSALVKSKVRKERRPLAQACAIILCRERQQKVSGLETPK